MKTTHTHNSEEGRVVMANIKMEMKKQLSFVLLDKEERDSREREIGMFGIGILWITLDSRNAVALRIQ
jgi:hypothetical protein